MTTDCVFCLIVAGEIPSTRVHETERTYAFRDIAPQAPTHVVVVPKAHHPDVADLVHTDPALLSEVLAAAVAVAEQEGLAGGYRLFANTGADAGQTVFHAHLHVLGGKAMRLLA